MYSRCRLQTSLSVEEALLRLSRIVGPPRSRWQAIQAIGTVRTGEPPFVGILTGERFRIRRAVNYRNNFLPVISGRIEPDAAGSRITVVVKVKPPVAVVMSLWLIAMSFGAAVGVWRSVQTGEARGLAALLLPFFGFALVGLAFVPEKRQDLQLLEETFDATAVENRHGR